MSKFENYKLNDEVNIIAYDEYFKYLHVGVIKSITKDNGFIVDVIDKSNSSKLWSDEFDKFGISIELPENMRMLLLTNHDDWKLYEEAKQQIEAIK